MTTRRSLLLGLGSLVAAPAIVRASSLMPVRLPLIWRAPLYLDFCRDFGGVGDGVTDNTPAWARMMAWVEAQEGVWESKGATVFVPKGHYWSEAMPPFLPRVRILGEDGLSWPPETA